MGAVDDGEAVHVWGQGVEGKLCTRLNLAVNLKLLPQNFVLKIQPSSLLRIYVLPFTCQISITSLKKKKKTERFSNTSNSKNYCLSGKPLIGSQMTYFFLLPYHSVFSLLILKSFFA